MEPILYPRLQWVKRLKYVNVKKSMYIEVVLLYYPFTPQPLWSTYFILFLLQMWEETICDKRNCGTRSTKLFYKVIMSTIPLS